VKKYLLKRIVVSFLIILTVSICLYSQSKEAFEIYYLPAKGFVGNSSGKLDTIPLKAFAFYELDNKIYFATNKASILVLDELTKEFQSIDEAIDVAGDSVVNILQNQRLPRVIQQPFSNSLWFFNMSNGGNVFRYLILDPEAEYPRQAEGHSNNSNSIIVPIRFPPKQLESEYTANDSKIIYAESIDKSAMMREIAIVTVDPVSLIKEMDTIASFNDVNSYYNNYITQGPYALDVFSLIDTFKIMVVSGNNQNRLSSYNLETKQLEHLADLPNEYMNYCMLLPNEVNKISDLKTHVIKRKYSDYKDIFYMVVENGEAKRMNDINLTTIYDKYKDSTIDWKKGDSAVKRPVIDVLNSNVYCWKNDEAIFNYYIRIDDANFDKHQEFSLLEELRRTYTIYNFNTGKERTFTIPKELFTRNDFDDSLSVKDISDQIEKTGYIYVGTLEDGIRQGFLIRQHFGNNEGYIFIIYDPRKDTTQNITGNKLINSVISPNPVSASSNITLDITEATQVKITLNDLLGIELNTIYNAFTDAGTFTKTFSTANLAKGIYYLKIFIGKDFKVEKVVVN
jgi:hypothetical protein